MHIGYGVICRWHGTKILFLQRAIIIYLLILLHLEYAIHFPHNTGSLINKISTAHVGQFKLYLVKCPRENYFLKELNFVMHFVTMAQKKKPTRIRDPKLFIDLIKYQSTSCAFVSALEC